MNTIPEFTEYIDSLSIDKSEHTIRSYKSKLETMLQFFEIKDVKDFEKIGIKEGRAYQLYLFGKTIGDSQSEERKNKVRSSVNTHFSAIKTFISWLIDNDYILNSKLGDTKALKVGQRNKTYLSVEEIDNMINKCATNKEKFLTALLLTTGLRRSEVCNIKREDIVDDEINIVGKGNKERKVYLTKEVSVLKDVFLLEEKLKMDKLKKKKSEYIFSYNGEQMKPASIYGMIKAVARNAGLDESRIQEITPHTLRRTFATNLVDEKVDISIIQQALGHSSISTTMRYANIRKDVLRNAMSNQKSIITKEKEIA